MMIGNWLPFAQSSMLAAALCGSLCVTGCGGQSYARDNPSSTRVGIVFDIGGKDDRSFNAAAWRGVHCAETGTFPDGTSCGNPALGIVLRDVEPSTPVNIKPALPS